MATTTQTQLDAVNTVLSSVGIGAVTSLTATNHAVNADAMVTRASQEVQLKGWQFNTECEVELSPTASEITVPANTLQIDLSDRSRRVSIRGGKLYDLEKHSTSEFTSDPTKVDVVYLLDLTEIPVAAYTYIAARAARMFQERFLGDRGSSAELRADEDDARGKLMKQETFTGEFSFLNNRRVAWAVRRRSPSTEDFF